MLVGRHFSGQHFDHYQPVAGTMAASNVEISRIAVLGLYRKILRVGQRWENAQERDYIVKEAKEQFRANRVIADVEEIRNKVCEASSRLEVGSHYKMAYPRMYYHEPNTVFKARRKKKRNPSLPEYN